MVHIITIREVNDYDKWRKSFDDAADSRKSHGVKSSQVFRSIENPNEVVIVGEWEDVEQFKQHKSSKEVREKMKEDVVGELVVYILEKV